MPILERQVVSDVLAVKAGQFGDPLARVVANEAGDVPSQRRLDLGIAVVTRRALTVRRRRCPPIGWQERRRADQTSEVRHGYRRYRRSDHRTGWHP